jgi:steroid delta-isomerase-like uncharacterized protein
MNQSNRGRGDTVSRRVAILRASGVGLGAATATAGVRGTFARAQATPAAESVPPVVEAWIAAYQARDTAAMAALYTDDAVYEDVPNAFIARGDEIPQLLATAEQGFSDVRVEVLNVFGGPGWGAVEYLFSATNAGIIPDPATAGRAFTSRAVTIFELDGDQIRRSADYYDLTAILAQLGLLPAPPSGGPPGATPTT